MLLDVLAVGCGGFIGAALRYLCTMLSNKIANITIHAAGFPFPIGILLINLVGCFLMGWLAMYLPEKFSGSTRLMAFVTTGCLGGFTTLSTFGLDTWKLMVGGEYLLGSLNIILTLAVCFIGIIGGIAFARALAA